MCSLRCSSCLRLPFEEPSQLLARVTGFGKIGHFYGNSVYVNCNAEPGTFLGNTDMTNPQAKPSWVIQFSLFQKKKNCFVLIPHSYHKHSRSSCSFNLMLVFWLVFVPCFSESRCLGRALKSLLSFQVIVIVIWYQAIYSGLGASVLPLPLAAGLYCCNSPSTKLSSNEICVCVCVWGVISVKTDNPYRQRHLLMHWPLRNEMPGIVPGMASMHYEWRACAYEPLLMLIVMDWRDVSSSTSHCLVCS